jgi:hypothetical protein
MSIRSGVPFGADRPHFRVLGSQYSVACDRQFLIRTTPKGRCSTPTTTTLPGGRITQPLAFASAIPCAVSA